MIAFTLQIWVELFYKKKMKRKNKELSQHGLNKKKKTSFMKLRF